MTASLFARCRAVPRAEGVTGRPDALHVDSADCAPHCMVRFATLNPFHFDRKWRIPVPGIKRHACSIESVWQGLKVVAGEIDTGMFDRPPRKRPPEDERGPGYNYAASEFRFDESTIDIITARLLIYLPTYLYVLDRLVPDTVVAEIATALADGQEVLCYDWDSNVDVLDPRSSFSHSAIVASWFGGRLTETFLPEYTARGGRVADLALGRYQQSHGSTEA